MTSSDFYCRTILFGTLSVLQQGQGNMIASVVAGG